MSDRRPWIAAVLAFLYPGLGHVYLRTWFRAFTWFLASLVVASLVVPDSLVTAFERGGLDAFLAASRTVPLATVGALFVVRMLNVGDAFLVGRRQREARAVDGEDARCPSCGEPLDEDLDFCPWCTTRLDVEGEGDGESEEPATSR